ncbi:MAG: ATP-dependent zinc metalloprotease FtsH [Clostridia bacterium]|nr:ATP-dependent zinc metalloprotease FtsH [Clostridia bacterium]MBQ7380367.1 ATP-dependent zinc metalloprotease FtsH [Clostridia bacterium]
MKNNLKVILFYVVFVALIAVVVVMLFNGNGNKQEITDVTDYSQVLADFGNAPIDSDGDGKYDQGGVQSCVISFRNKTLTYTQYDGKTYRYEIADMEYFQRDLGDTIVRLSEEGLIEEVINEAVVVLPAWVSYLPFLLIIVVFIVFYFVAMKRASSEGNKINNFGKARVKTPMPDDKNKVRFKDVAGADEEKMELQEIVEYLKAPGKFSRLGAKIPHGVLLMGPPGTGKTLLAKAVAGEAGVPFFSISGSDFVEMYVGVGASRVRDLFENARKAPASIIFIDEIDAVGRHRGAGLGGGHDEREQTLNQLLVEMDGFGSHEGIIVIAATNRPDILDPALLRPGRFDRQITVNYPDMKGREEILRVHAKGKPMEDSVDFAQISKHTPGFTGADLANLLNEAALLAARKNKSLIGMEDIDEAYLKVVLGPQKKSHLRTPEDNKLCAYHEAGHAVVSYFCPKANPVSYITIIPAGSAGGVTLTPPTEDRMGKTKGQMLDDVAVALGGRAAEQLVLEDISTGASSDIQHATSTIRSMITRYGMSEALGTVLYGTGHSDSVFLGRDFSSGKDYSEETAAAIDRETRQIMDAQYKRALDILTLHMDKLEFIAQYLLDHENMDGDQFKAAMEGYPTVAELEQMLEEKKRKSREANEQKEQAEQERARREAEEKANENPFPYAQSGDSSDNPFPYAQSEDDNKKD